MGEQSAEQAECPTCGPTTLEQHPRRPTGVARCVNCKEHLRAAELAPPDPAAFVKPERHYAERLAAAIEVVPQTDKTGTPYSWLFLPSRNTWPTWHVNRPAPTPGCCCGPCQRPMCCGTFAEPVVLTTGETVAWVCPTCFEPTTPPAEATGDADV